MDWETTDGIAMLDLIVVAFDAASREVYLLMERDSFRRFIASPLFLGMVKARS